MNENDPKQAASADIYSVHRQKKRKKILKRGIWCVLLVMAVIVLYRRRDAWLPKLDTIGVRHQGRMQNDPALSDGNFPLYLDGASDYQAGILGDKLALLGDNYFYIYETDGGQAAARQHTYGGAMLQTAGNYALLYELGGTRFRLETVRSTRYEKSTAEHILFARVSESGMAALVTASETCACKLLVFNQKGQQIYERDCIEPLAELCFNADATGCYAASIAANGGAMQTVLHAYSFSQKEELWTSQPLDMLAISVYNTEGDCFFVLGDTEACYLNSAGAVLSTYTYPDALVEGCCDANGTAALLLSNSEKRNYTAVILNGTAKDAVLRTYDKEIRSIGLLTESSNVLVLLRNSLHALSYDGVTVRETSIGDGCDTFLRIGSYLFLIDYDQIDRITYRTDT